MNLDNDKLYRSECGKKWWTGWYAKLVIFKLNVRMPVKRLRFSQYSINHNFRDGQTLETGVEDMKSGKWIPTVKITRTSEDKDNMVFSTLDNRRLFCARRAGLNEILVEYAAYNERKHGFKFSRTNGGEEVKVDGNSSPETEDELTIMTHDEFSEIEDDKNII